MRLPSPAPVVPRPCCRCPALEGCFLGDEAFPYRGCQLIDLTGFLNTSINTGQLKEAGPNVPFVAGALQPRPAMHSGWPTRTRAFTPLSCKPVCSRRPWRLCRCPILGRRRTDELAGPSTHPSASLSTPPLQVLRCSSRSPSCRAMTWRSGATLGAGSATAARSHWPTTHA